MFTMENRLTTEKSLGIPKNYTALQYSATVQGSPKQTFFSVHMCSLN